VKIQESTPMAARPPVVLRHTGAEYESGRVHRHLMNEEQPTGGMLRTGGGEPTAPGASPTRHRQQNHEQNAEQMDLGLGLGDCNSPAHSTWASVGEKSAEPSPRDVRAAARTAARHNEDDLVASLRKPWRGQANNLKGVQKKVLAQFEEVGVRKKKLEDGVQIDVAVTKYWVQFDGIDAAEYTERLNITRMFEKLLASKKCPAEIKRELAAELNNKAAKAYLGKVRASGGHQAVIRRSSGGHPRCLLTVLVGIQMFDTKVAQGGVSNYKQVKSSLFINNRHPYGSLSNHLT
jgi:hypothetical protein